MNVDETVKAQKFNSTVISVQIRFKYTVCLYLYKATLGKTVQDNVQRTGKQHIYNTANWTTAVKNN